jgi:RluA family pseudouridine synthase
MSSRWRVSHSIRLIDALKLHVDSTISARFLKRALEANVCRINGKVERFGSVLLQKGDLIELSDLWKTLDAKRPQSCPVIFENEYLVVVDKSAGLICTDAAVRSLLKKDLWLAHRLDKDTTGALLLGKDPRIAKELQDCFEKRNVEKDYLALVDGSVEKDRGVVENRLVKKSSFQGQTIWGVSLSKNGLYAKTEWIRLASKQDVSLIHCQPMTGRTHQIRVHLAHIGHPILVDRQYASQFRSPLMASRPLLHARRLQFEWRQQLFELRAPLPPDFQEAMKRCQFPDDLILP